MLLFVHHLFLILSIADGAPLLQPDTGTPYTERDQNRSHPTLIQPAFMNFMLFQNLRPDLSGPIPYSGSISAGYCSDKLAVTPYREYLTLNKEGTWQRLVARLLDASFDIAGRTAEESSHIISEAVRGGVSLYGALSFMPFNGSIRGYHAIVRSAFTTAINFPDAPFLILFSEDDGLRRGNDLPLTHLGMEACIATDLSTSRRLVIPRPPVIQTINRITRNITDFDICMIDAGITATLGNMMIDVDAVDGGIHFNEDGSNLNIDAKFKLRSSGVDVRYNDFFSLSAPSGFPVTGTGAGIDAAITMRGPRTFFSAGLYHLGPMVWFSMREADIQLRTANLSYEKLSEQGFDLFNHLDGGISPSLDTGEITRPAPPLVCWLPARCALETGYRFTLFPHHEKLAGAAADHIAAAVILSRDLTDWPGLHPTTRCVLTAETDLLYRRVPLRLGLMAGGICGIASSLMTGVTVKGVTTCIGYEAAGSPLFFPQHGCTLFLEVSAGK